MPDEAADVKAAPQRRYLRKLLLGIVSAAFHTCCCRFYFHKRNERIDWRRLVSLDLERIRREVDVAALQVWKQRMHAILSELV